MWIWASVLFLLAIVLYGLSISSSVKTAASSGCGSCPKKGAENSSAQ